MAQPFFFPSKVNVCVAGCEGCVMSSGSAGMNIVSISLMPWRDFCPKQTMPVGWTESWAKRLSSGAC